MTGTFWKLQKVLEVNDIMKFGRFRSFRKDQSLTRHLPVMRTGRITCPGVHYPCALADELMLISLDYIRLLVSALG